MLAIQDPSEVGPTSEWQDTLIRKFSRGAGERVMPFGSSPSMSAGMEEPQAPKTPLRMSLQGSHIVYMKLIILIGTGLATDESALGELTISENNQVTTGCSQNGTIATLPITDPILREVQRSSLATTVRAEALEGELGRRYLVRASIYYAILTISSRTFDTPGCSMTSEIHLFRPLETG